MDKRQKILIVDDSKLNRDILKEILGDAYNYLEAENGNQAIQMIGENIGIDLMLLVHIEAQGILNSFLYNHRIKRSCDIICDSQLICLTHSINSIFRRYHDYRSFSNTLASFHYFQDFKTIHLWHIDI